MYNISVTNNVYHDSVALLQCLINPLVQYCLLNNLSRRYCLVEGPEWLKEITSLLKRVLGVSLSAL